MNDSPTTSYHHLRIPLLALLYHPRCKQCLLTFATGEHSEETISFIDDVEALRTLGGKLTDSTAQTGLGLSVNVDGDSDEHGPVSHSQPFSPLNFSSSPCYRLSSLASSRPSVSLANTNSQAIDLLQLRDFSVHIDSSFSVADPSKRDSSLNCVTAPAASPSVSDMAMKVWLKYGPNSEYSISWAKSSIKVIQEEIRRNGGLINDPHIFNAQQTVEIENVNGDLLKRFYLSRDYAWLVDQLLDELALALFNHVRQNERHSENNDHSPQPMSHAATSSAANTSTNRDLSLVLNGLASARSPTVLPLVTIDEQSKSDAVPSVSHSADNSGQRSTRDSESHSKHPSEAHSRRSLPQSIARMVRVDSGISDSSLDSAKSSESNSPRSPPPAFGCTNGPGTSPVLVLHRGRSFHELKKAGSESDISSDANTDDELNEPKTKHKGATVGFLLPRRSVQTPVPELKIGVFHGQGHGHSPRDNPSAKPHVGSGTHGHSAHHVSHKSVDSEEPMTRTPRKVALPPLFAGSEALTQRTAALSHVRDARSISFATPQTTRPSTANLEQQQHVHTEHRPPMLHARSGSVFPTTIHFSQLETNVLLQSGFFVMHFSPLGAQILIHFMVSEYSHDNYAFIQAVQQFNTRALDERERRKQAKSIYSTFLSEESTREVTFPSELRHEIVRQLRASEESAALLSERANASSHSESPNPSPMHTNRDDRSQTLTVSPPTPRRTLKPTQSSRCLAPSWTGTVPQSIFDSVLGVVLETVRTDIFRRFIRSNAFADLSEQLKQRHDRLTHSKLDGSHFYGGEALTARPLTAAPRTARSRTSVYRRPADAACEQSQLSFGAVLEDPALLAAYSTFCSREHSEELILFYQAVRDYSALWAAKADAATIDVAARRIHARFIQSSAPFEVHLPLSVKQAINAELNLLHPQLFDDATQLALTMMQNDSGKRFLLSEDCQRATKKKQREQVTSVSGGMTGRQRAANKLMSGIGNPGVGPTAAVARGRFFS